MKIKTQIWDLDAKVEFWRTYTKYKKCRTHWTFSAFKASISGTLQRFDYGHSGHETQSE